MTEERIIIDDDGSFIGFRFTPKGGMAMRIVDFEAESDTPEIPTGSRNLYLPFSQVDAIIEIILRRGRIE